MNQKQDFGRKESRGVVKSKKQKINKRKMKKEISEKAKKKEINAKQRTKERERRKQ